MATKKKTYPSEPVPTDYVSWSSKDKLQWLDSQGYAHDPTINLGDCYRSGAKVTQIFTVITKLLQQVYASFRGKTNQTIWKALSTFLNAYNKSITHLSNDVYSSVASLLTTGQFNNESNLIEPVSISDLPIENEDGTSNMVTTIRDFKEKIWPYFLTVLELLQDKWTWLSKVNPIMNVSYNNLIKAMVDAGETFFLEYQKEQDKSPWAKG
ncbi:uncharacterized protein NECHADRAFT_82464 [Fusarium vanettenii 77-13-4]|uniref:Uncharacterized protein n=1 Tax=Fusarium vanettenii (strain ATCC MYA-4622 / CBS 123669 / FGSC 9596 / NRRL 45880 / 77-13-4) TaxID=660122 RepID=C7ZLP9_FUSV7|nr:uncharacterized protein NECHADRAFT_82464 [Fusarium vanettenii 77-13-4]EEU35067.1 predicted protein [Fusarium vanettenii 77-13-4]